MSIDAVIRDELGRQPVDRQLDVVALQIANKLGTDEIRTHFIELLMTRISDILRLNAATARNNALNNGGRSWKHAGGRSPWQQMCDSTVWVDGQPKRTGACNREDLAALIEVRRAQVGHLNNQIANFQRLIQLLDHHDVKYVDEIPEEVLV